MFLTRHSDMMIFVVIAVEIAIKKELLNTYFHKKIMLTATLKMHNVVLGKTFSLTFRCYLTLSFKGMIYLY